MHLTCRLAIPTANDQRDIYGNDVKWTFIKFIYSSESKIYRAICNTVYLSTVYFVICLMLLCNL